MGLLDFLRRLLGGQPASPNDQPSAPDTSTLVRDPRTGGVTPAAPKLLAPLRYRSSLNRTATAAERVAELPYRFANLSVDGDGYLDLSTDADERWLEHFDLPHLRTPEDLANFLQLPLGKLAWLTHRFEEGGRPAGEKESHYHHHWVKKKLGGHRLIEAPKQTLKMVQRRILRDILDHVPPHPAAHGFVTGRSIRTNAEPHVGKSVLLKFDLQNFYPSVRYSRVVAIFRSVGFSREVAIWLGRLTTSAIPASLKYPQDDPSALWMYYPRHLPQGACTSPALANLSAFALDVRLTGLARKYDVHYTRYADDLTFSGTGRFGGALSEFIPLVTHIAKSERFYIHRQKRRVLRGSQRQTVAGVVVNEKPNVSRRDFDRLKSILHNCAKHGPSTQNHDDHPDFAAHLAGRIGHVLHLNPHRGAKLRELYNQIDWSR
ncbi:MAG: RNA-directed DNA polymerase [Planctomycetaceae bacterium]|nr:RNA-directed DNA polymerase [Planctomycetaceae bacterium]